MRTRNQAYVSANKPKQIQIPQRKGRTGTSVTVIDNRWADFDMCGWPWLAICEDHDEGQLQRVGYYRNKADALDAQKNPDDFCEDCLKIQSERELDRLRSQVEELRRSAETDEDREYAEAAAVQLAELESR